MQFVFKSPLQTAQHIQNLQALVDEINKLSKKAQWLEENIILDDTKSLERRIKKLELKSQEEYVTKEEFKKLWNYLDRIILPVWKKSNPRKPKKKK